MQSEHHVNDEGLEVSRGSLRPIQAFMLDQAFIESGLQYIIMHIRLQLMQFIQSVQKISHVFSIVLSSVNYLCEDREKLRCPRTGLSINCPAGGRGQEENETNLYKIYLYDPSLISSNRNSRSPEEQKPSFVSFSLFCVCVCVPVMSV